MQGQSISETMSAIVARDPFFTVFGVLVLVGGLWFLYKLWLVVRALLYDRHATIYQELDLNTHPVPPPLLPLAEQLTTWGMQLIGVLHAKRKGMGEGTSWYYVSPDGTMYVELVNLLGGLVGFATWYPNNALVETMFPFGESIATPKLHVQFARNNLEVAYDYQRQFIEGWKQQHGNPIRFKTMSDFVPYRDIYRQQYRVQVEARLTRLKYAQTATLTALTFVTLFSGLVYTSIIPFDFTSVWFHILTGSWFAFAGLLVFLQSRAKRSSGAIDSQIPTQNFRF